ncbi:acyl carrier protein [Clostridium botulinum]|uniref:Acyl carrier protein n=1 Tax=Clostridium botulinum TaxID=1491 RepID=A0A0M1LV97_CLOBO|nr:MULTISPECIES: phosphopantetheine-binding protein [Clostridium]ACD51248.1 D-alanine--poly(phosphoribitol) ligase subunit 2, homolog [Clostridium botulinum E3 str. Alaska E43]AJF30796.1 acyl carrier protein [Clostridium botulinum]AJF33859.1 acyl carrier protein [Clostridium botulinum]EES50059.1 D-alanine--poly(phosphoribitol) ligase subunit 2, homolog [Clostridium botulinum E1 str. 'BoNT E Beluga']KAI3349206.1 phosphopantetheine-binding protein [Clostridium botulinum]
MEKLISLLEDIRDDVDFKECTTLIEDGILDSFDIIQIVNAIDEEFDVEIPATEIIPENFNSADSLLKMIRRLEEEE